MLKADFHVHTYVSKDADINPENLVRKAKELGFNVIALTNHNTLEGYEELVEAAKRIYNDLLIIRGVEIDTIDGEIIALNIKKNIPKKMDLLKTCKLVREQEGFIIIPHAFDKLRKGIGKSSLKILDYVDAIEGFNSRTLLNSFNNKNVSMAKENGKPLVAGSDSHFLEEFGSAYTLIDSKKNINDIFNSIKKGKTKIFGKKTGLKPHWKTFLKNTGIR